MCVFRRSSSALVMTERSGACSTRSCSSCRSITPPQVNRDTLWRRPVTGGPALTFWHIYTVGSRGAASPLSHLAECLAALMDEARPLRPAEFYLRLTSRCCHRCFLAAPPSSISLLHSAGLSASPLSALTLSVSLSFYFFFPLFVSSHASYGQYLSLPPSPPPPPPLCQQASLFVLARPLSFIRVTNKVESKHAH